MDPEKGANYDHGNRHHRAEQHLPRHLWQAEEPGALVRCRYILPERILAELAKLLSGFLQRFTSSLQESR